MINTKMSNDILKFRIFDVSTGSYIDNPDCVRIALNANESGLCIDSYNEDIIIEWCTGLKDMNNKLIYVGDIVKCGNDTATVGYSNDENFIDGVHPFNLYHLCGDECCCHLRDFPEYACEIIGNVHEKTSL